MGAFLPKLGLAAIAALAISGTANAAVTISNYTTGAGSVGAPAGQQLAVTFDGPSSPGYSYTLGGTGQIVSGTNSPNYQAPNGDATQYLAVLASPTAVATLFTPANLTSISMYIGSIDTFNTIAFYNTSNSLVTSFTGTQLIAAGGGQDGRFFFDLTGQNIGSVTFKSTQNSMEIDNIAAGVPEPGVWAMMMLGMGGLGYALRRRRFVAGAATA